MTFDPQHDYESMESAKARFNGRLQQPTPCGCHMCRMFDVEAGPMLTPAMQTMPDGSRRYTGRWMHGRELKAAIATRRELFDRMKATLVSHGMVER
jgi:hypothetical protein